MEFLDNIGTRLQLGSVVNDENMRAGYKDGNLVGPKEREVDFGMRDDYVNKNILTGIITESKIIGKYKDKEKYSNPEKLEAHLNQYIDMVAKNTEYAGTLNRGAMMDEFAIELSLYNVGQVNEREPKAVGGEMDEQMNELMPPVEEEQEMLPDENMEDDYLDFIIDEALDDDEKELLLSKLEQDNELQILFDKVVDVAQEFAGSGPVEGPGSGISDSIPARLSDGEFVITAKAADQLGPENLQDMMDRAEEVHDMDRNAMKDGGSAVLNEDSEVSAREAVSTTTVKEELMKLSLTNTEGAHIHS